MPKYLVTMDASQAAEVVIEAESLSEAWNIATAQGFPDDTDWPFDIVDDGQWEVRPGGVKECIE